MTFYVGQKVVCVDASSEPGKRWVPGEEPVEGRVYTVAGVRSAIGPRTGLVLTFKELRRSSLAQRYSAAQKYGLWAGYVAERFRPVVERKTDISIFKAMLNPAPDLVDA